MTSGGKQKIAVLGGGVGALSAAFYLTEQPGWDELYEITVYQHGWRLGGKCASGHDLRPGYGWRIYEHGLHIFAGFYDQAFDLLRRAYDVVDRPDNHPNQRVWDAFSPEDCIGLVDDIDPERPNQMWYMDFSPNDQTPGDSLDASPLIVMIQRLVSLLITGAPLRVQPVSPLEPAGGTAGAPIENPLAWLKGFVQHTEDELRELALEFVLHQLILALEQNMKAVLRGRQDPDTELEVERFLLGAYLVQSIVHGVAADDLLNKGYDSIDKYEWSEWLYANALAVAQNSPIWGDPEKRAKQLLDWTPISSLYDYVFGYGGGGDTSLRNFAAGTALRSAMLMISYKGHFFWKMRGAMGDVVIAPLYLALKKRGVKFSFFSRITALNIDPSAPRLASIDYVQQAALKEPSKEYQPLINVAVPGWPEDMPLEGWPDEPLWEQLADGPAIKASGRNLEAEHNEAPGAGDVPLQLQLGVHFDKVVLGISVGGLKQVCASFPERLPHSNWGPMFETITLTRTCAMQLWLTRSMDDLGCTGSDRTLTGAGQPYSSWSDMSHLLTRETWNGAYRPRSIAYFCGQIPGPQDGPGADHKAYEMAVQWLQSSSAIYWSRATSAGSPYGLDPKLLFDPDPAAGGDVLTRQYIRANTSPSELYVQSPKNSVYTRMDANQSGVDNLFLTGDWTLNGINSGCAESAARSGARCADAIADKLQPLPL